MTCRQILCQASTNPKCLVTQATKFYTVASNIFSMFITILLSCIKGNGCQFTYTEWKAPDTSDVHRPLRIVSPQCGVCFISSFKHLGFEDGSEVFGKFVCPCFCCPLHRKLTILLPVWTYWQR